MPAVAVSAFKYSIPYKCQITDFLAWNYLKLLLKIVLFTVNPHAKKSSGQHCPKCQPKDKFGLCNTLCTYTLSIDKVKCFSFNDQDLLGEHPTLPITLRAMRLCKLQYSTAKAIIIPATNNTVVSFTKFRETCSVEKKYGVKKTMFMHQ